MDSEFFLIEAFTMLQLDILTVSENYAKAIGNTSYVFVSQRIMCLRKTWSTQQVEVPPHPQMVHTLLPAEYKDNDGWGCRQDIEIYMFLINFSYN